MSGSFLRSGGLRARELLSGCRGPLAYGGAGPAAQRPRAYFRSIPAECKFSRGSSSHLSPATSAVLSPSASRTGFVSWYIGMIEARPMLTKAITAGVVFTGADITSQIITLSDRTSIDWLRTLRMGSYGMLIAGPTLHLWYNFASRCIPKQDSISSLKKMIMGQIIFGPPMTTVFFSVNAALQGENSSEILARLKRDLLPTLINSLLYWPMCDFVTLRFVPVRLQPLANNLFSFLWTIYITYVASLKKAPVHQIAAN